VIVQGETGSNGIVSWNQVESKLTSDESAGKLVYLSSPLESRNNRN
jgi:hypothetical protein